MAPSRGKIWATPDATKTTVECIALALEPTFTEYLVQGGFKYESEDMKTGIDIPTIIKHKDALTKLLHLDPRGGWFGQRNMMAAIDRLANKEIHKEAFKAWCAPYSEEKGIMSSSYAMRVMLSHVRIKKHAFLKLRGAEVRDGHPDELRALYAIINDVQRQQPIDALNPFIHFRHEDGDDDDEQQEEEEEEIIVWKAVVVEDDTCKGKIRLSSGAVEFADRYTKGEDGFAICVFEKRHFELQTEMPNTYVSEDGKLLQKPKAPPAVQAGLKKRPAASKGLKAVKASKGSKVKAAKDRAHNDEDDEDAEVPGGDLEEEKEDDEENGDEESEEEEVGETDDEDWRQHAIELLPKEAHPLSDIGEAKQFTLKRPGFTTTVSIMLDKKSFLVKPLTEIPKLGNGEPVIKTTIQKGGGVHLNWNNLPAKGVAKIWGTAMLLAGWT